MNQTQNLRHCLNIHSLNSKTITQLLNKADSFLKTSVNQNKVLDILSGQVIANLFFEPSTRTLNSFIIAAKRLGAIVLAPHMKNSATRKGESLIDTAQTFEALGARLLVVRHQENNTANFLAAELNSTTAIINAGDGKNQHPTQALLDLLTIRQHKLQFKNLTVSIVGDITHSRVARSLIEGLNIMGTPDIRLIAPRQWLPDDINFKNVNKMESLSEGLKNADVVVALRIQKERMKDSDIPDAKQFFNQFGITSKNIQLAKPDVIVMHPGPINRGTEIESSVVESNHSAILQQVANGVAIRMSLMETLLSST